LTTPTANEVQTGWFLRDYFTGWLLWANHNSCMFEKFEVTCGKYF